MNSDYLQGPSGGRMTRLLATLALSATLGACVYSPLPEGSVTRLYHWPDRGEPIAERSLMPIGDRQTGYLFSDILSEQPGLADAGERAYLLESCLEDECYSAVVFPGQFRISKGGEVVGLVHLTALSTAMANYTAGLPQDEIPARLSTLARTMLRPGLKPVDYQGFLALDLHGKPGDAGRLKQPALLSRAQGQITAGSAPSLSQLMENGGVQTSDLVASETFLFSNSWDLAIDIDVSARRPGDVYLTVCGDYRRDGEQFVVDYSNCQLKTALNDGRFQGSLRLTGVTGALLVTLVSISNPDELEFIEWQRSDSGDQLTIR